MLVNADGTLGGPVAKNLSETEREGLAKAAGAESGDCVFFAAGEAASARALLGALRLVDRVTPVGGDARRTRRVRYEVRDAFLRLWLAIVLPHREAFELGRGAGVLAANRSTLAASQQRSLRMVLRSVLADRHQADCGPWWSTTGGGEVDALALAGGAAGAGGAAQWTTNADLDRERLLRIRATLPSLANRRPEAYRSRTRA